MSNAADVTKITAIDGEGIGPEVTAHIPTVIGVILSAAIWRLQACLLRWQIQTRRGGEQVPQIRCCMRRLIASRTTLAVPANNVSRNVIDMIRSTLCSPMAFISM